MRIRNTVKVISIRSPLTTKSLDFFRFRMLSTDRNDTKGVENSMRNIKLKTQSPSPPLHELITINP